MGREDDFGTQEALYNMLKSLTHIFSSPPILQYLFPAMENWNGKHLTFLASSLRVQRFHAGDKALVGGEEIRLETPPSRARREVDSDTSCVETEGFCLVIWNAPRGWVASEFPEICVLEMHSEDEVKSLLLGASGRVGMAWGTEKGGRKSTLLAACTWPGKIIPSLDLCFLISKLSKLDSILCVLIFIIFIFIGYLYLYLLVTLHFLLIFKQWMNLFWTDVGFDQYDEWLVAHSEI